MCSPLRGDSEVTLTVLLALKYLNHLQLVLPCLLTGKGCSCPCGPQCAFQSLPMNWAEFQGRTVCLHPYQQGYMVFLPFRLFPTLLGSFHLRNTVTHTAFPAAAPESRSGEVPVHSISRNHLHPGWIPKVGPAMQRPCKQPRPVFTHRNSPLPFDTKLSHGVSQASLNWGFWQGFPNARVQVCSTMPPDFLYSSSV